MAKEEFTPEEQAALAEMESGEAAEASQELVGEQVDAAQETETDAGEQETAKTEEPEKSTSGDVPDWGSLTAEQKEDVQRLLSGQPPRGMVPHQALHQTREQLKELNAKIAQIEESRAAPKKEEAVEWADPLENPEQHRKWVEAQNASLRQEVDSLKEASRTEQEAAARQSEAQRQEEQFAAKTPDYPLATQFLYNSRVAELQAMGHGPQEIQKTLSGEVHALFNAAQAAGLNFASLAYQRAMESGYKPQAPVKDTTTVAKDIEQKAAAQQKTQGLGATGGEQAGKITAAQIAEMSVEEIGKLSDADLRAAMGG